MHASPSSSIPTPASRFSRRKHAAFTLLEVMVATGIFVIGGVGAIQVLGMINTAATLERAYSAARLLVGAKIAKAQTDTYTTTNKVVPTGCIAPANNLALTDSKDGLDSLNANFNTPGSPAPTPGTQIQVVGSTTAGVSPILGTMYHYVSTYEAASGALLITYRLDFVYRGTTYSVTQSTIRTPDQI